MKRTEDVHVQDAATVCCSHLAACICLHTCGRDQASSIGADAPLLLTSCLRLFRRSLLVMPLFHVHGLMAGLLGPLAARAAVILPAAGGFSARTFWQDAVQQGATFYTAVPTMHQVPAPRLPDSHGWLSQCSVVSWACWSSASGCMWA